MSAEEEVYEAPLPGEWEIVPDGVPHLIPDYDKDLIPDEPVDTNFRLEVDPVFQYVFKQSLAPYFDRLSSTVDPCSKVIWNKNEFLRDEAEESRTQPSEPLMVWNNNCIIRTNKKELLDSQERRRKEDREFDQLRFSRGGQGGGFRGRRRGRGARGGGFSRSRPDDDRTNPNEVKLGERRTSKRSRSRSPLLPRSYERRSTSSMRDSRERSSFHHRERSSSHRERSSSHQRETSSSHQRERSSYHRERPSRNSCGDRRDSKRSRTDSESSYGRYEDRQYSKYSTHDEGSREHSRGQVKSYENDITNDNVFVKPDNTPDRRYNRERSSSYRDGRESQSPIARSSSHVNSSSRSSYRTDYESPTARSVSGSFRDKDKKEERRRSELEGSRSSPRASESKSSTPMTYGEYKRRKELQLSAGSSRH